SSLSSLKSTFSTSCCASLVRLDLIVLLPRSPVLVARLDFAAGLMPVLQLLNGLEY
ncbi:hypothetical protein HOY80DRAFT_895620, partial [Tuber brumale]